MSGRQDLVRARAEAEVARERMLDAAQAVQARLRPASLASDAWDTVRDRGEVIGESAARVMAERPVVASAAALGVLAMLARKPISRLFSRGRKD